MPYFSASPARSFSIAAASPKPLSTRLPPSAASAVAMPRPMPLVEPVTIAALPLIIGISPHRVGPPHAQLGAYSLGVSMLHLRDKHETNGPPSWLRQGWTISRIVRSGCDGRHPSRAAGQRLN